MTPYRLVLSALLAAMPAAAQEAPIGVVVAFPSGDTIELYERQGLCSPGTGEATYIIGPGSPRPEARGRRVLGCWVFFGGQVFVLWTDGDRSTLALDRVEWQRGKRPGIPVKKTVNSHRRLEAKFARPAPNSVKILTTDLRYLAAISRS